MLHVHLALLPTGQERARGHRRCPPNSRNHASTFRGGAIIKSPYSRFSFYCGLFSSDATTSIAWRASGSPGRSCRAAAQCSDSRNFISVAVPSEIRNVTFRTCPVRKSATERSFFLERSVFFSGLNLVLLSTFKSWRLPS